MTFSLPDHEGPIASAANATANAIDSTAPAHLARRGRGTA